MSEVERGRGNAAFAGMGPGGMERTRPQPARELVQLCAFLVGAESYAIDIMRIKEIINPLPITRVPKSPDFVEGVIELRGAILPVVDLRRRFDLAPAERTRATKFLIVAIDAGGGDGRGERWILGIVVDRVMEVIRIPKDEIRPPPAVALDETSRYFSGVCRHEGGIVMVMDLDAILSSTERLSLSGMSQAALPLAAHDGQEGSG